jgi:hypothetical protein
MALNRTILLRSPFASRRFKTFSGDYVSSITSKGLIILCRKTSIPRKFKWSGELRINTEKGQKERLCNVTLSDVTDGSTARLRFTICFGPSVSLLLLEKLFSLAELQSLRPALAPVTETARLGPDTSADEKLLTPLFLYMSSRKLACPPAFFYG